MSANSTGSTVIAFDPFSSPEFLCTAVAATLPSGWSATLTEVTGSRITIRTASSNGGSERRAVEVMVFPTLSEDSWSVTFALGVLLTEFDAVRIEDESEAVCSPNVDGLAALVARVFADNYDLAA